MWRPGTTELIIILVILLLLFGSGRIVRLAKEMGSSIKAFRQGIDDEAKEETPPPSPSTEE